MLSIPINLLIERHTIKNSHFLDSNHINPFYFLDRIIEAYSTESFLLLIINCLDEILYAAN